MIKKSALMITAALLFVAVLLAGCATAEGVPGPVGPAGPAGPQGPAGPPGQDATLSMQYVGSEKCGECHEEAYTKFMKSGHPYKLTKVENGQPPVFPYDEVTGGVQNPPDGYTWGDISYVIGGFAWKARFIDQNGYIITGDADATTQWNFANETVGTDASWVGYHAGEANVPYDCGTCHTTGYRPEGHQDDLEGIIGTWAFPGIQCEECHGPGSLHTRDPYGVNMVLDRSNQLCGNCHVRGNPAQVDAADGFIKHHEQYEELYNSKHFALQCIACHDPHASTVYADETVNPDAGIRQSCNTCHWQQEYNNNRYHFMLECVDCHMPAAGMSAVANSETFTGDISSHLFSINPDPEAPQFTEDGLFSMPYLTLDYACNHCHGVQMSDKTPEELGAMAEGYHTKPLPTPVPAPTAEASGTP